MTWQKLFENPVRPSARDIAHRVSTGGGTVFIALALVKLARLNGVAPLKAFTRHEIRRLKFLAEGWTRHGVLRTGGGYVRFFQGPEGPSVELTAKGWKSWNDAVNSFEEP